MLSKIRNKLIAVIVAITITSGVFAFVANNHFSMASPPTDVYVDPSTSTFYTETTSVGDRFNISLRVTDVTDLYAWQVKLYFNATQIQASDAWLPTWDPEYVFYGMSSVHPTPVIDNVAGYVLMGDQIIGAGSFTGNGLLGIIEFEIMMTPPPNGTLSCILDINNADTYLLDSTLTQIPTTKTNGSYEYIWSQPYRDIAITDVSPSRTVVGQGYNITIQVTLQNLGNYTETFTVWTFCGFHQNLTLPSYESRKLNYTFNTSKLQKGNYTVWAYVLPCFGDDDPIDNLYVGGTFLVTIPGDVNGDHKVDWKDIYEMILHFMCKTGQPCYVPNDDVTCDGKINYKDIYQAILHFMESW